MSTNSMNVRDASGTVTTGGASNVLLVAAQRQYLFIQNPITGAETLFVDFGIDAAPGTAYELAPGGTLCFEDGGVPGQSVNVRAATTAHAVICKWA
jgi:hypothetical protein